MKFRLNLNIQGLQVIFNATFCLVSVVSKSLCLCCHTDKKNHHRTTQAVKEATPGHGGWLLPEKLEFRHWISFILSWNSSKLGHLVWASWNHVVWMEMAECGEQVITPQHSYGASGMYNLSTPQNTQLMPSLTGLHMWQGAWARAAGSGAMATGCKLSSWSPTSPQLCCCWLTWLD